MIGSFVYFLCTRAVPFSFNKILILKKIDFIVAMGILISLRIVYNISISSSHDLEFLYY
jgi:hypothetical protein